MLHAFDIFRVDSGGGVLWQGTQENFIRAKTHVQEVAVSSPGQYIILNQRTGEKVVLGQLSAPPQVATSGVESGDAARNDMG